VNAERPAYSTDYVSRFETTDGGNGRVHERSVFRAFPDTQVKPIDLICRHDFCELQTSKDAYPTFISASAKNRPVTLFASRDTFSGVP
jgi:hypothetical protein